MVQISVNTQNSQLTLTVPRPPSLLGKALAVLSHDKALGDIFVFDLQADTLTRSGRRICALSEFQSARIDKWLGMAPGGDPLGARFGLSVMLVDGRKITLVEAFGGQTLDEMNRVADAVSRYTSVHVHREE